MQPFCIFNDNSKHPYYYNGTNIYADHTEKTNRNSLL